MKVSTAFAPNSSSSNWLVLLELRKTQPLHLVHTEEMSMYSQKGEQVYDLRAWFASYTRALCSGALEKSAGEIPDCSLSKEKLRINVFGGLQPTPTWLNPLFSVKCLICQQQRLLFCIFTIKTLSGQSLSCFQGLFVSDLQDGLHRKASGQGLMFSLV